MTNDKPNAPKAEYGVLILRRDQQHIQALLTSDYDSAFKLWEELSKRWQESVKETIPFRLISPVVTSFDPGLISEITIRPVVENKLTSNPNNPYEKEMREKGFSETFGRYTGNANAIPEGGGYKL